MPPPLSAADLSNISEYSTVHYGRQQYEKLQLYYIMHTELI